MRDKLYGALSKLHFVFKKKYSRQLRVLAYHKVPDALAFEKQVSYLKSHYNIVSIPELLAHFEEKTPLPKNALLITFDDGDISVLRNGLPILKKYGLNSSLFIITGLVNTFEDVWIKRVEAKEMKEGKTYRQAREVVNHFKQISNAERKERMKSYPAVSKEQLTTANLTEMHRQGMFIGNHTHTHPMLDKCTIAEITAELNWSEKIFKDLRLPGYNIFAYPNGNANNQTNDVLQNFGMKLVFLFDHKINEKKLDPFNVSRIMVDSNIEMKEFKAKVSGAHPFFFNLGKRDKY